MTQEEKAKAYDEALERARKWYDANTNEGYRSIFESIFPELKESEDEMIRKKLITFFQRFPYTNLYDASLNAKDVLAWLEKQGEQKPADKVEPKFKVGDTVTGKPMSCHGKVFKGEPFKIVDIIEDNYVSDDGKTYSISLQDGWELVEQKPTDKVELKFKVGDYIERKDGLGCHAKIIFIGENVYGCEKLIHSEDESPFFEFMFKNQDEFQISSDFKQKPAWSEEDEELCNVLMNICGGPHNEMDGRPWAKCINWLKSLKERYTWKPSDEQIEALKEACDEHWEPDGLDPLYTLYQDLKKLREE